MERQEVLQATKAELPSTTRVYLFEFLFDSRHATEEAARHRFDLTFRDRVDPEDVGVWHNPIRERSWELWIRRWNMVGEYKDPAEASEIVERMTEAGDRVQAVPRNSRVEHKLKAYGTVKIA